MQAFLFWKQKQRKNTRKPKITKIHAEERNRRMFLSVSVFRFYHFDVEKTKHNTGVHLQIAFNYGSRAEIVNACKKITQETLQGNLNIDAITEETFSKALYTGDIPEPDILIRTGGEMRISNYLLWQIAYSELYILDCFWPDFGTKELCNVIIDFGNRNRRWGK